MIEYKANCGNCKFSKEKKVKIYSMRGKDFDIDIVVCRKSSPFRGGFPTIEKTDWCGDYKSKLNFKDCAHYSGDNGKRNAFDDGCGNFVLMQCGYQDNAACDYFEVKNDD